MSEVAYSRDREYDLRLARRDLADRPATCAPGSELYRRPVFDGFPHLVSRVHPALYHIIVLPRDRTEEELLALAQRQVTANRLETFLALGHRRGMNYSCDGVSSPEGQLPRCTAFVCDKLRPAEDFPQTPELVARIGRLQAYIEALHLKGSSAT